MQNFREAVGSPTVLDSIAARYDFKNCMSFLCHVESIPGLARKQFINELMECLLRRMYKSMEPLVKHVSW